MPTSTLAAADVPSPDCAVRFDLEGDPVELFDRPYRPGEVVLSVGGRAVSQAELMAIISRQ
jgi:hypothetical protein